MVNIDFIKPSHKKGFSKASKSDVIQQNIVTPELSAENVCKALYKVVPTACLFTSVSFISEEQIQSSNIHSTPLSNNSSAQSTETSDDPPAQLMETPGDPPAQLIETPGDPPAQLMETPGDPPAQLMETPGDPPAQLMETPGDPPAQLMETPDDPPAQSTEAPNALPLSSETSMQAALLAPLTDLYDESYELLSATDLQISAEKVFVELSVTDIECQEIKKATCLQSKNTEWKKQRNGRLTASIFYDVFARKATTTKPFAIIQRVMGYDQKDLNFLPAIKWGNDNEDRARQEYVGRMSLTHSEFTCTVTGLIINTNYPHLGASPDGMTKCKCCGSGLVEIKCPFSAKNFKPDEIKEKLTFISQNGKLKRSHKYYIQIQGQLSIADKDFCDFVIWTPKCLIVERIYRDINLWEKMEKKLTEFFVQHVLPEIMTRSSASGNVDDEEGSTDSDKENIYCLCRSKSDGYMIGCDNPSCEYQWFHYKCVGIKRAPSENWYCPRCISKYNK